MVLPSDVVGESWSNAEARARFAESNELGGFLEGYLTCLQLESFFSKGVLTMPWPQEWRTGIDNVDDERYLLGLVGAVHGLERYAIGRARVLDLPSIRVAWRATQCVEQAMLQFDFRNSTLRHRYDSVKYVVKRLETIAYEVDLAQQRQSASLASGTARTASEDPPSEVKAQEPAETGTAVDLALLGEMKERYDKFTDTRDQVIKRSRDVGKAAKNAVYALQRADFKKADGNLALCAKEANNIWQEHVSTALTLRSGGFTGALEEVAEAVAYRAFLKEQKLLTRAELQQATGLSFELTIPEYLGGLMDLTGEVGRLAIRKASAGREAVGDVEKCLACVEGVFQGVQDLVYLPGGVGKKMGALRSTLLKIEGVLYELALLSHAGIRAAKAPEQAQQRDDAAEADDSAGL